MFKDGMIKYPEQTVKFDVDFELTLQWMEKSRKLLVGQLSRTFSIQNYLFNPMISCYYL